MNDPDSANSESEKLLDGRVLQSAPTYAILRQPRVNAAGQLRRQGLNPLPGCLFAALPSAAAPVRR